MPTRLIIWNINRFSINTINDTRGDTELERLASMEQSWQNLFFIENIARHADIFVVIEVQSTRGVVGSLIGGTGKNGVLSLLTSLRQDLNPNWCLVPPLKLAGLDEAATGVDADNVYTEGIGVFFRSDKLNFTGPYVWPTTGGVASPPFKNVTSGPYPKPWANALPANNFSAGQPQFFKNPGQQKGQIYFTTAMNRRPFLTSFTEKAIGGRNIVLLTVHPTPGAGTETAVARISSILEILPRSIPQVVAVVGDFNVDVHKVANPPDVYSFFGKQKKRKDTVLSGSAYQQLKNIGLIQAFDQGSRGTNGVTFIEPINKATPQAYLTNLGLDNMFLRYDGKLPPPAVNPRIIDPVTGTDEFASDMLQSLDFINNSEAFNDDDARDAAFRKTYNYGHIAHFQGVSDHLPLVADI